MAFDQTTRNRLARFVGEVRALLTEEFTRQLQHEYGLDPASGAVTDLDRLTALDDTRRETARILRETMDYYLAGAQANANSRRDVLNRIVREQAFTVLNRLCALRMVESRGLLIESVGRGYHSKGFQLYARLAGPALGETGEAYRSYLFSLFDEFAVDLPVLFDRFSPQGRLFPRKATLIKLLEMINDSEIEPLWAEDETIGWIYQYFNSKEERQQMRAESQAPRNSRELAVRNQFFTPRYVVEFLTDNTLGRIWYEMTKGETMLKETCRFLVRRPTEIFLNEGEEPPLQEQTEGDLSQEELLRSPVFIPYRLIKDPREIKMLDPACGSMHFGLYAFDLFGQIYAEAWELEEGLGEAALWRMADLDSLHATYRNREAFLRDVPRLIIEHNIHGIDIDPRAVQIAGLSLWLRAQKSWQAQGLKPHERPQIRKSNVVCAEPMPGDREMLEEFLATLQEDRLEKLVRKVLHIPIGQKVRVTKAMVGALANLVRNIWQEMELAGEAGSLLKIEEYLREAITRTRKISAEKAPLFRVLEYGMPYQVGESKGTSSDSDDGDFWSHADALVLTALQAYAEQASNGANFRRRLFAGDAAQGFAFIELCQKLYDIVVMNPPFGIFAKSAQNYSRTYYPNTYNDIFAAFIERFLEKLISRGSLGTITSRNGFFLGSFEKWRTNVVMAKADLQIMVDLGENVMDDAMVEAAAYCIQARRPEPSSTTSFIRLLGLEDREAALFAEINNIVNCIRGKNLFIRNVSEFTILRLSTFVYWVQKSIIASLSQADTLDPTVAAVRCGLSTGNNDRFVRVLWEIPNNKIAKRWFPLVMTGTSQPWFSPLLVAVDWQQNGYYLSSFPGSTFRSTGFYFKPGISWTRRAVRFIPYAIPAGCIPSASRYMAFPKTGYERALLGFTGSNIVGSYMRFFGEKFSFPNYLVDSVKSAPWIDLSESLVNKIEMYIEEQLRNRRKAYQNYEPFHEFIMPKAIATTLGELTYDLSFDYNHLLTEELDREIAKTFGFSVQDASELERDMMEAIAVRNQSVIDADDEDQESDPLGAISEKDENNNHVSYLTGVVLGRWDIRYATGEKPIPELPDPFAPLPACPPGMLQNAQGLPAAPEDVPADYPLRITWGGILVDDVGHPEDVQTRVCEALHVIWCERAEAIETEACQILGVRSLREYFQKPALFFADHLKRYSKSRRQAPIYWPLSTPSSSYTLWLYYHRLSDQILFTCVNDFVDPKLKQISEESSRLRLKKGRSAANEKELERLTDFERELKDFRAELLRVAAFWKPNLNDGVEITAAPLWKLFQHRPWQKKLKETWGKLEAGDYDWAHLAYSIWPERVREKCKTDKSLAIAHDLEHLYIEPKISMKKKAGRAKREESEMEDFFDEN